MPSNKNNIRALIADDDPDIAKALRYHLISWRLEVSSVYSVRELLDHLSSKEPFDILLLDVRFGEADGLELVRGLGQRYPNLFIVIITAYGSIDLAISAIKSGARDFLIKPIDTHRLKALMEEAIERRGAVPNALGEAGENRSVATASGGIPGVPMESSGHGIIGRSQATLDLVKLIRRVAPTEANILILGESGTGKEMVARAVHHLSRRYLGPFLPLNMAALSNELVESTLFGHEKGAFTGADAVNIGAVESADGGTLFLDEIGEMKLELQAKVLRFLQERTFYRVGSSKPRKTEVRIVAATNRDLMALVKRGLFREDLYYRLNVVPIRLLPLGERADDIPDLIEHFLNRIGTRNGTAPKRYSSEATAAMRAWTWPGNARELENTVERIEILSEGPTITLDDLPPEILLRDQSNNNSQTDQKAKPATDGWRVPMYEFDDFDVNQASPPAPTVNELDASIDSLEKRAIEDALVFTGGNVRAAARRLRIGAATIYRKMKKYGISRNEADAETEP